MPYWTTQTPSLPPRVERASLPALIVLVLGLMGPLATSAQPNRLYLSSGVSYPMGPGEIVDWWRSGLVFDAAYGRQVGKGFELTLGVGHSWLPISNTKLVASGVDLDLDGGDFRLTSVIAGLRFEMERGAWFRPYLHLGLGLHSVSVETLTITVLNPEEVCPEGGPCLFRFAPAERPREMALGLKLGAGIAYYLGESSWLFAEPNYHIIFVDGDRFGWVPIRLGIAKAL